MENPIPKVTVCLPVHNGARFLQRALESALEQKFRDFELLILDDASRDETGDIASQYKADRIRYVRNEKNLGLARNLERGLELSRGEYLIYLCQDDLWFPDLLDKQVRFLDSHRNVGFVHTANYSVRNNRIVAGTKGFMKDWPLLLSGRDFFVQFFLSDRAVGFSTVMARRAWMLNVGGFDREIRWNPDSAMWLRLALCSDVGYLNEYLAATGVETGTGGDLSLKYLREDRYFEDYLFFISRVFQWPEVKANGLLGIQEEAIRKAAQSMPYYFHLQRLVGLERRKVWRLWSKAVRCNASLLLDLQAWLRLCSALILPKNLIQLGRYLLAQWRLFVWVFSGKLQ